MQRKVIFVHGRAQQGESGSFLKDSWIDCFNQGAKRYKIQLRLKPDDVIFLFYADTLVNEMAGGYPEVPVVAMGNQPLDKESDHKFLQSLLVEACQQSVYFKNELTSSDETPAKTRGTEMGVRDALVHLVKVLDKLLGKKGSALIRLAVGDVDHYLRGVHTRDKIVDQLAVKVFEEIEERSGLTELQARECEFIVVGHSLGSIVAYDLIRKMNLDVRLFMTLGSPLWTRYVTEMLAKRTGGLQISGIHRWVNIRDPRDIVSLVSPVTMFRNETKTINVENLEINNTTKNHHGICPYIASKYSVMSLKKAIS